MAIYKPKIPEIHLHELEARPQAIVAFGREYPSGHLVERHQHGRAQLIYASKGVMRVDTPLGVWVVPPMRAIWVPPAVDHEIRASSTVHLRTLFFRPDLRDTLPRQCCVIEVSGLLRELILRMVDLARSGGPAPALDAMTELILGEIREHDILPMHVPLPNDPRLLRVCHALLQNPADSRTSLQWGSLVGASSRTLERLFQRETGTNFRVWRQQVRLLAALSRLAAADPIAVVAQDLGYQSPSAFTAMFKRTLGCSPRRFFPAPEEE
ncbi:MAG TPA: helix-turn-helix transcriptional regulator [Steroidobacteraceae bacterium]|nr:helix-turn-helix transcriptional regulator [Steroidobacteraceae bacterium]